MEFITLHPVVNVIYAKMEKVANVDSLHGLEHLAQNTVLLLVVGI